MKRNILIAIDVDGTLLCNKCTPQCTDPNQDIVDLTNILARFKNVRVMVWSNRGKDYAQHYMELLGVQRCFAASKIDKDTWVCGVPNIAIDDQQSFDLADFNLIVREK